ncbi:MAG: hypothetical protein QGG36_17360 [Pirellulaceae bacterium]|jgi:lipoate-protein ligase A|nr:hypothetical protein [Pirellulaceae bacterium]
MDARLIIDEPAAGAHNMAVDEWLLHDAGRSNCIWLRLYQWNTPTLTLGYFQSWADRALHPASSQLDTTRRASGGGAIVHDRELTYSVAIPTARAPSAGELYDQVHQSLVRAFAECGVDARLCDTPDQSPSPAFLCFARRATGDILCDRHKIVGSAQRRRRLAVLQHGSILLQRSDVTPQLSGIAEAAGISIERDSLEGVWLPILGQVMGWKVREAAIPAPAIPWINACEMERFRNPEWLERR